MTRSRKQKAAARNLSVAEDKSYVNSLYSNTSPFTGAFKKALENSYRHTQRTHPDSSIPQWEKNLGYCGSDLMCDCNSKLALERMPFWEDVCRFLPSNMIPELAGTEWVWPSYDAWDGQKKYEPSSTYTPIICTAFYYPEGTGYGDHIGLKDKLKESLPGYQVAIRPAGDVDDAGRMQLGSIGTEAFYVLLMEVETIDHFSPYEWANDFSACELFDNEIWNINRSVPIKATTITTPSSPRKITRIEFSADDTMTRADMQKVADALRGKAGVPWVSVMEGEEPEFVSVLSMESRRNHVAYLSNHPSTTFTDNELRFWKARQVEAKKLRFSTSGEKTDATGLQSVFSGGSIVPVGFSDCSVERGKDGIISTYRLIPSED